jgi:YidC/Oxa1 family membrane protein insertase
MDTRRLLLFIVFTFSLFMLWEAWKRDNAPPPPPPSASAQSDDVPAAIPTPGSPEVAAPAQIPGGEAEALAGERIEVRTDVVRAVIDTMGGDLVELELFNHPDTGEGKKPFMLFGTPHRARFQSGLVRSASTPGDALPKQTTLFKAAEDSYELAEGQERVEVPLTASTSDGVKVVKTLVFRRNSYQIEVRQALTNNGAKPVEATAYFHLVRDAVSPEGDMFMAPTFTGPAIYTTEDHYNKLHFKDIDKKKVQVPVQSSNGWIAMVQHYFVAALTPPEGVQRSYYVDPLRDGTYRAGLKLPLEQAAPGQTVSVSMPLYAGPQDQETLAAIAPELDAVVDYGILEIVGEVLFAALQWLYGWLGNWGLAIIALTIIIKAIFFPLSAASYKSMAKMRLISPKLQKLKEQYGDDRMKMNQAMMELYKTEKINPLGGCLPILVQIPVFIALYWVLLGSVELRGAPFYGWIQDLSRQDPYYILPTLMMGSMFIQTRLNPTPPDPIQAKVMMVMPFAFGIMFYFFPAGLVLYWLVNNILSIAQQWQITRMMEAGRDSAGESDKR